jgi:hypothetical protein
MTGGGGGSPAATTTDFLEVTPKTHLKSHTLKHLP